MISVAKLKKIGLSEKEAVIYLSLLRLGESRAVDIAKRAELNRTTTYSILQALIRRGIINQRTQRGVKVFYIEDVNQLKEELEEKEQNLDLILPELVAEQSFGVKDQRITQFEGVGGVRDLLQRILDRTPKGEAILEYVGSKDFYKRFPSAATEAYPNARLKKRVSIRTLTIETPESKKWKKEGAKYLREVQFLEKKIDFPSIMQIYPKGIGIMSFSEDYAGVLIEDPAIGAMMRSMFELAWSTSN